MAFWLMPNEPASEWPSVEEFGAWLKADPKNYEWWLGVIERSLKGEYGEIPPEMRAASEQAIAKRNEVRRLDAVAAKFAELTQIMQAPPSSMPAEERLALSNAVAYELTDLLLETPEPHRTNLLKEFLPLREMIQALKVPE